jgi:ABC-2 type transport system permease protein
LNPRLNYFRIFLTFARNSIVRDMTFRANFLIDCLSTITWSLMDLGFYILVVFRQTSQIGRDTGWGEWEFYTFLATTKLINGIVQAFFMPNCEEVSELIRTGNLDFALLKPIDTQFLISLRKIDWPALSHIVVGGILISISLWHITQRENDPAQITLLTGVLFLFYILCGVAILYSLMISLAATSIWLGRNESLYDFWFYITNFSRYPMEIYSGRIGSPLRLVCTYIIPVLVVVNVPARILAQPLLLKSDPEAKWLPFFTATAAVVCLALSRWVFYRALRSYRSASS